MSEHKQDGREFSGRSMRQGMSMRTQPPLAVTLAAMQDLSFDASWIRAKDKALESVYGQPTPKDASRLPQNKKLFFSNNKEKISKINYEKFGPKKLHHRARHNLQIAHDFFPIFYEKLKSQIEPTLSNANNCLAMLGMQGTATQMAQSEARGYQRDAARYGAEATASREQMRKAVFDARMAGERADKETIQTMEERQAREREAKILVEAQSQAAKAMNEENEEMRTRNMELERENIRLNKEMELMQDNQIKLASKNGELMKDRAELMKDNSEIRKRASSKREHVGILNLDFGSVDDSSAAATSQASAPPPPAKGAKGNMKKKTRGWSLGSFRKRPGEGGTGKGTKGGKRKRTRKKCNNRRLKKKMLCVRGTKRRLKKLKKHTKRLKLKLTRCSKKRLAKNFSVRKKRKYTRRK